MTALSELLAEANVNGWSSREVARRAEKFGHKLSYASSAVYFGGRHGEPTEGVLAAFSDVLNIPIDKLREAAGVPTGADTPWTPPTEANRLDIRQRRALEELIRSMVTSETIGEGQKDDDQESHASHPDVGRRAVARPPQPDGVIASERRRPLTKDDFERAADDSGPSLLEADDARAALRGEESQDPEDWS